MRGGKRTRRRQARRATSNRGPLLRGPRLHKERASLSPKSTALPARQHLASLGRRSLCPFLPQPLKRPQLCPARPGAPRPCTPHGGWAGTQRGQGREAVDVVPETPAPAAAAQATAAPRTQQARHSRAPATPAPAPPPPPAVVAAPVTQATPDVAEVPAIRCPLRRHQPQAQPRAQQAPARPAQRLWQRRQRREKPKLTLQRHLLETKGKLEPSNKALPKKVLAASNGPAEEQLTKHHAEAR